MVLFEVYVETLYRADLERMKRSYASFHFPNEVNLMLDSLSILLTLLVMGVLSVEYR